jgi:hypothetical protein
MKENGKMEFSIKINLRKIKFIRIFFLFLIREGKGKYLWPNG